MLTIHMKTAVSALLIAQGAEAVHEASQQQSLEAAWEQGLQPTQTKSYVSPVKRVTNLLQKMKDELVAEADKEAEMYDKMVCWCETNEKEKKQAIADADAKDKQLVAEIETRSARFGQLSANIENSQRELKVNTEALNKATAIREGEASQFRGEEKDFVQAITNLRNAIQVLSFSNMLKLDGASLILPERKLLAHRGSLSDFVRALTSEYSRNLLSHAASILGRSSMLKVPRAPLKLGGTAFAYMSDSMGLLAGEAGSLLNNLTFDEEYVNRQRAIRENKKISNIGEGVAEAAQSIATGIEGMLDIVNKPAEGLRTGGFGGFFSGVAQGVTGAFVKPISGIGQALQDLGAGVSSTLTPDTAVMKRRRNRFRTRQPRMLYSGLCHLRPWSEFDADVQSQLGRRMTHGLVEVIPLTETHNCTVLLLFSTRLAVASVQREDGQRGARDKTAASQVSSASSRRSAGNTSSSSSSSQGPAQTQASESSPDLVGAFDESALKLFSQALKPLNTIMYGWQDMQGKEVAEALAAEEELLSRANWREFGFQDLQDVCLQSHALDLVTRPNPRSRKIQLPLGTLQMATRQALANGLRSSLVEGRRGLANWDELRQVIRDEQRSRASSSAGGESSLIQSGAGHRTLEVFEVERFQHLINSWKTPFQPLVDAEASWRWVDASGQRHPHLKPGSREMLSDEARFLSPPCELDKMFKPKSKWVTDINDSTDEEGWRYALAWNSSTWDLKPALFDVVRKRRWTRIYN